MNIITQSIKREREYSGIIKMIDDQMRANKPYPILVCGMGDGVRGAFYPSIVEDLSEYTDKVLIIVPDEKEVSRVRCALEENGIDAYTYPMRDFVYHNITASHEFEHERLGVLSALVSGNKDADLPVTVVTTPDAVLQYTIPRARLSSTMKKIEEGKEYPINDMISFLDSLGFVRVDMVDGVGQFSVRGCILDIFPPGCKDPIRCEYFDDEIEQISYFDILTQRRIDNIPSFDIMASRELIIDSAKREELIKAIKEQIKKAQGKASCEGLASELEALESGRELYACDKYISYIYPEKECLADYFSEGGVFFLQDWNGIAERIKGFEWHSKQSAQELIEECAVNAKYADYCKWGEDLDIYCSKKATVHLENFAGGISGKKLSGIFSISSKQIPSYAENLELLKEEITYYTKNHYTAVLMCENETMGKNLVSMLDDMGIRAVVSNKASEANKGSVSVVWGIKQQGFELITSKFVCLSTCSQSADYHRSLASKYKKKQSKKSSQERILSYADLSIGDYVVHASHGIGQYLGLQTLTVDGVTKDFVKIKYDGKDMLYLPCNQLDMVSKYIGATAEDGTVKLSRIGGGDWTKTKTKVKAAAKEMAKELIQLYAERQRREGFAFDRDDEMQREFESSFEFEETDGQLIAIKEIKSDMEKRYPMDRLLCGDVGFGKTEVALRAAFKAINSSKQVAILVPTTILALQHYQTILTRMRGFPVTADMLSRFRTPKQQQETIRKIKRGEVDIVAGTHRLLSKDIEFKDLGLLIIDEEQRFGVAHKEKLKQLAKNVDVLMLTATPIPRTLNMAMSGIRDMSILEEAPGDRLPVQTYVLEYDELIITEAIKKELRRGGQVFYLHNSIESIDRVAAGIVKNIPEARVVTAHGQMDKEQLSDIWRDTVNGDIDVLVCTTIIETGIDVPNANTLIIDNADRMGLSQLHQIRGRVGRSSRRAYAYFTYPKGKVLSEVAEKRLSAIRDFTEFGSGFKVALRDLEIRGAGNILGAEQHGHIASVGYDLYMKLLNEAILEEKGEGKPKKSECQVDFNFNAYIPEKYIRNSNQRIDAYKKISYIESIEDHDDVGDELTDRYGEIPSEVKNLLKISLIRSLGSSCELLKIEQKNGNVVFKPQRMNAAAWTKLAAEYRGRLLMNLSASPYSCYRIRRDDDVLETVIEMLGKYKAIIDEIQDNKSGS